MVVRRVKNSSDVEWSDLTASRVDVVPRDGWVRLLPLSGLDAEEVRSLGLDSNGEKLFELDRKLARDVSLFCPQGRQMYFSDTFIDYLVRAQVTGWSEAILLRHFTPNKVNGRAFYRVEIEGELGTIHKSTRTKPRRVDKDKVGRVDGMLERQIFEPVTLDGASWTGHDLCLSSQWLVGFKVWRALFIKAEALHRRTPPPDLFLSPLAVVNLATPRSTPGFLAPQVQVPELPSRRTVAEVWAELEPSDFTVPPKPESVQKLLAELQAVGLDSAPEAVDLMTRANGAVLFEHGLIFATVGDPEGSLPAMKAEDYGYEIPDGWSKFAYAHRRAIAWCCNREGKVRGFGEESITYGPNVSVAEWFSDQVADLRWARKQGKDYLTILGLARCEVDPTLRTREVDG